MWASADPPLRARACACADLRLQLLEPARYPFLLKSLYGLLMLLPQARLSRRPAAAPAPPQSCPDHSSPAARARALLAADPPRVDRLRPLVLLLIRLVSTVSAPSW